MTYSFRKQVIAVIGATGQIGKPLTQGLLSLGHEVKILSRKAHDSRLDQFQGATVAHVPDLLNKPALVDALRGCETLICAVPASPEIIEGSEPVWLDACVQAGIKRFVPTEFGAHTRGLDYGDGILFDAKKRLHEKIFQCGMGWTFFYNGGIFDYFLPNYRFFEKMTQFGDTSIPIYTHEIEDIGRCAALALSDDRTLNKCVQMDFNCPSQQDTFRMLRENWPNENFDIQRFSSEFITDAKDTASNEISAKKGAETDRERWGINYVIYVKGGMASFTDETCRASELYPNFQCEKTPEAALKDPAFVFDLTAAPKQ